MRRFLRDRWFLICLAILLAVGVTESERLAPIASIRELRYALVACVLFIMALPLEARLMWLTIRRPGPALLACAMNYGLLPLVAWALSWGLSAELAGGMYVAAATPCTLASAAVWTRRAGGNDAVAIMVTVITNLSCFVLTPLWLYVMTGQLPDSPELQLGGMIVKLALIVVLPMALAQLIRFNGRVGRWSIHQKSVLSVLAQCGVLSMVLMGAVQTGQRMQASGQSISSWPDLAAMVGAVVILHLTILAAGLLLARALRMQQSDRIAVGIAGSQKTLMVGLQVGLDVGLSILPIVLYHVSQLLLDTLVADYYRKRQSRP